MILLTTILAMAAPDPTCPEQEIWPETSWQADLDSPKQPVVDAFEAYAFPADLDWNDKKREGVRTDGVVIIKGGKIIYERYANGYGVDRKHLTWSVSKTFTSVLTGLAVAEGLLTLDDSVCTHLSGIEGEACDITVRNVLELGSGLRWQETYEDGSPTNSSVLAMLYGEGWTDMARFVANHPREFEPGTAYRYSSGDTNLLSGVLGAVMAPAHGERWPWEVLFDRIGMQRVTFERDGQGTYVGSSWLWTRPRDMARLGYLMLNDGCWDGDRMLPEGWMAQATQPSSAVRSMAAEEGAGANGWSIWVNQPVPESGITEPAWPEVSSQAYSALGHWKQAIFVSPEDDIVVVRTGDDRDGTFDWNTFFKLAIAIGEYE